MRDGDADSGKAEPLITGRSRQPPATSGYPPFGREWAQIRAAVDAARIWTIGLTCLAAVPMSSAPMTPL